MYERQKRFLVRVLWLAAVVGVGWLSFRYLLVWLLPFLIALALAALAEPVIDFCRRRLHLKRGFTAAVLTLLLVGGLLTLLGVLLGQLLQQAEGLLSQLPVLLQRLPQALQSVQQRLESFCAACPESVQSWAEAAVARLTVQLTRLLDSASAAGLRWVTEAVTALPQAFLFTATTVLAVFFTAGSFPDIMDFLRRQLQPQRLQTARGVKQNLFSTLGKWLRAQAILLAVTFTELLAGLLLLRERYALLLAVLIALIDALPVFGTGTVLIPWAAVCLIGGSVPRGVALLALYGVISLVRSFLEPKVMAAQVGLPPLVALLAMYVGFCVCSVAGMVLFPILLLFVKQLHDEGYLHLWK